MLVRGDGVRAASVQPSLGTPSEHILVVVGTNVGGGHCLQSREAAEYAMSGSCLDRWLHTALVQCWAVCNPP